MSEYSSRQSTDSTLPRIAITVGEVGGVGPELAIRAAAMPEVTRRCIPILVGPVAVITQIAERVGLAPPKEIVDVGNVPPESVSAGTFSAASGQASYEAVCHTIDATLASEFAAMVTGPIQKEAWHRAGIRFPGHTELLAQRTKTTEFSMMLTSESISCVLATVHIPLGDVTSHLTTESVSRAIEHGAEALGKRLGRPARVSVCGLNPHAGEGGVLSHGEETEIIAPAIESARSRGRLVEGPLSPDTAFTPAMREQTDVYVCMYHDQGLIPLKALAFDKAVNVTLGLPIVRTSVDHGTALDLAWTGRANHESMLAAIVMAADLA